MIVDYGMGNLYSVLNAIKYLNYSVIISNKPAELIKADSIILPGVGSFKKAMDVLNKKGLSDALKESVLEKKKNILGICLGMQLFASKGDEEGPSEGLGFIDGEVKKIKISSKDSIKLPHIGFNEVNFNKNAILGKNLNVESDFYFVHSFHLIPSQENLLQSKCFYGSDLLAACEYKNIFATQFHPEKSQANGLQVLKNFLET